MAYNYGTNFGYDQVYVNPFDSEYGYSKKINRPPQNIEERVIERLNKLEPQPEDKIELNFLMREREYLKSLIDDLRKKNDLLTLFLVFIVIVLVFNNNHPYSYPQYYANTLSMARMPAQLQ